eukprot:360822-Chlamydomonas_euryale.AAC.4
MHCKYATCKRQLRKVQAPSSMALPTVSQQMESRQTKLPSLKVSSEQALPAAQQVQTQLQATVSVSHNISCGRFSELLPRCMSCPSGSHAGQESPTGQHSLVATQFPPLDLHHVSPPEQ